MARFNMISAQSLMRQLGTPAAPTLIDVTLDADVADHPYLLPTARRWPHDDLRRLVPHLAGRKVVTICQKGRKLSQGAAALLRAEGVSAEALEGGNLGWSEAGLPRLPLSEMPSGAPGSLWVTRHRPRIDRIACPWLIRRFVDPQARFLFVAPDEVPAVSERFGATSFDAKAARYTHDGDRCTFDTLRSAFGLAGEALDRMAEVIRAADTGAAASVPEAPGLLALSVGLSRGFDDDLAQLDAGMILYDALYRWARDGQGETHGSQELLA